MLVFLVWIVAYVCTCRMGVCASRVGVGACPIGVRVCRVNVGRLSGRAVGRSYLVCGLVGKRTQQCRHPRHLPVEGDIHPVGELQVVVG